MVQDDASLGETPALSGPTAPQKRGFFARIVLFLRQVIAELRKVIAPTRQELLKYTAVVLAFVVIVMAVVYGLDILFTQVAQWVFGVPSAPQL